MIKDIRQCPLFADFMKRLGWQAEKFDSNYVYMRKFPFIGYAAKVPRPDAHFSLDALNSWLSDKRIFQLRLAPFIQNESPVACATRKELISYGFHTEESPFNPTTTIHIDLSTPVDAIFQRFSQAKRRAVRRAIKNNVYIKQSEDIGAFIELRKHQYRPMGFLITNETRTVFETFFPKNASLLLAYSFKNTEKPIAGILMLFYDAVAYYWFATALPIGKYLFAPTFLVWEALKTAKKRGCSLFDFEGVYDGRFPKAAESWKGFTKFKEGFGGKQVVYMENFSK